jgi:hypothetical protein
VSSPLFKVKQEFLSKSHRNFDKSVSKFPVKQGKRGLKMIPESSCSLTVFFSKITMDNDDDDIDPDDFVDNYYNEIIRWRAITWED